MREMISLFSLIILMACKGSSTAHPCPLIDDNLLAFPGAQGFGAYAQGGRMGTIIEVTNLNDSGEGSLRKACSTPGPRIVVFKTGGNIALKSSIRIEESFITIAGQTAPGDGITISGATLIVSASETIIRGLRIRVGSMNPGDWDGIALLSLKDKPIRNIMVDHCSISWSIDENVSTNGRKSSISNVTFSLNIISEGLNDRYQHSKRIPHSAGMLINKSGVDNVSIIGNLFAHNKFRQPKIGLGVTAEIVNNVMYNWETKCTTIAPGAKVNVIGNRYIQGPNWNRKYRGILLAEQGWHDSTGMVYLRDNLGPGRDSTNLEEWAATSGSRSWKVDTPVFDVGTISLPVNSAYGRVLEASGAWPRDAHDKRVVSDVIDGTGKILFSEMEVGGLLHLDTGSEYKDSDGDGFPDRWELKEGFDPNVPNSTYIDHNCNGYPDFEDYLNSLLP